MTSCRQILTRILGHQLVNFTTGQVRVVLLHWFQELKSSPLPIVCITPAQECYSTAESLHFLIGFKQGEYREDMRVSQFALGSNYTLDAKLGSEINDWAILKLTEPPSAEVKPLPRADEPAKAGDRVTIGGFAQIRRFSMTVDPNCTVTAILSNGLLVHDCTVMKGDLGGPLLRSSGDKFEVLGIHVASGQIAGVAVQIAVPVASLPRSAN